MPFRKAFFTILSHCFSTATTTSTSISTRLQKLPPLSNIHTKYKPQAIQQAQKALTDYLHATRSLPFTYAEHIGKNSIFSLSNLIRKIDYSVSTFPRNFRRLLRYHPINEFEFFFESIGIDYNDVSGFLPSNKFFFSEDGTVLNAACALSGFGFPWNMLGKLYTEDTSIFSKSSAELTARLSRIKEYGFSNLSVVGLCLAFPKLLSGEDELGGDIEALFGDFERVFVEFGLGNCVEGNVDACYEVCRKIRVFYDLGCQKGKVGELMSRKKILFLECSEEVLVQKADYFCKFGIGKGEVGLLLLQSPEILNLDLETPVISVLGFLQHFGLSKEELQSVRQKYSHVLGRNKMVNLPHSIRALDLQDWFFNKITCSHELLATYAIGDPNEDIDQGFINGLKRIQSTRTPIHTMNKLNFLHGIGFGENALTMKVLTHMHGNSSELQGRFDCLLNRGIKFSKLCTILRMTPKILSQNPENLEQKVNFLCQEMGSSLQYLDIFPAFLCFDLENRIKPRYRFHVWLTERGLCSKNYSIASMIATSEKSFVSRLSGIHPAAPKQWLECFLYKRY
ncbi:transcription termination factor MTEF18, mitochondrial [Ziziphus jujuba]|uniref:Transcription termination factor MTEF18, mitochondrial n=2 Tax=Ziziphus jujuba TaxID=326968 RepID=A0A6P4A340_ZIZJJ|nr:transcription termination factor MTEF18, mitochondrial [Ziziphus jujuba]